MKVIRTNQRYLVLVGWLKMKTVTLAGTALFSALVVVFDYTLKFSGLKIPFPWLPFLKFDFTGIPIVLSLLLYGLPHGATTSIVAFLAILLRSGDFVGSSMKGIAEFFTILGMVVGLRWLGKFRRATSFVIGIIFRCISMSIANFIGIPTYYGMSLAATLSILSLIVVFNAMQGCLSILVGYSICEALRRRVPSLIKP